MPMDLRGGDTRKAIMATATPKQTTDDIYAALRSRYAGHEWAAFYEVGNGTGMAATRRCDCVAMCLWPSKGLHLHGHEVKASRSDWLKEIQDPSKAEAFAQHCHYWWVVALRGIVKPDEMPPTWGLMELSPSGNLRVKSAPAIRSDCSLDYGFLAAILRRASEANVNEKMLRDARNSGYDDGYAKGRKDEERSQNSVRGGMADAAIRIKQSVARFEEASGLKIDTYGAGRIGDAVRRVIAIGDPSQEANRLDKAAAALSAAAASMRELSGHE